jgi:hypothetical protein
LDRKLGGPQSWSGRCGEEINCLDPEGNRTPAIKPVAIPPDVSRLMYELFMKITYYFGLKAVTA